MRLASAAHAGHAMGVAIYAFLLNGHLWDGCDNQMRPLAEEPTAERSAQCHMVKSAGASVSGRNLSVLIASDSSRILSVSVGKVPRIG